MNYIVYSNTTGQIIRTGITTNIAIQAEAGETAIEGVADDATQKINLATGEIENKTNLPTSINKTSINADGTDVAIISGVPQATRINLKKEGLWIVNDGSFEFTTDTPGEYVLELWHPLYLDMEYTINAS